MGRRTRILLAILVIVLFVAVIAVAGVFAWLAQPETSDSQSSQEPSPQVSTTSSSSSSSVDTAGPPEIEPVTPEEAYAHAQIVSTIAAQTSPDAKTEAEAIQLFADRGFTGIPITTSYEMDGAFHEELEAIADSTDRHPVYTLFYATQNGDYWQLLLQNGQLLATPLSYNWEADVETVISESTSVTSYDSATNAFYEIIPDGTDLVVKVVPRIDIETIDGLTAREIGRL